MKPYICTGFYSFSEKGSRTGFPLDFLMYQPSHVMLARYPVNEVRAISSASWGPILCSVPRPQTTALTSVSNSMPYLGCEESREKPCLRKYLCFNVSAGKKHVQYRRECDAYPRPHFFSSEVLLKF